MKRSPGFAHTDTPVVVVNCQLGALSIMRSLGMQGIVVHGVGSTASEPALRSRYCSHRHVVPYSPTDLGPLLSGLLEIAGDLGAKAVLIPTSDETAQFVAENAAALRQHFLFQDNSPSLVRQLASKREMFALAKMHGVPTPETVFPTSMDDVDEYAERGRFPVMLKAIYGNRQEARGQRKMQLAETPDKLRELYERMEDPAEPNLMLQEFIPGGDDQVYIFNGYFNHNSECPLGFTGFKIRQFPVHVGCASLGECSWIPEVATVTTEFMRAVGYRGILDIGYRLDPRDRKYKVLDINPRVGQAFRLFVADNDHDVVRALYLDLTGQPQPPAERREGRRWLIEDYDAISSLHYWQEGTLGLAGWARSLRGVEEGLWFSWRDPMPFLAMTNRFLRRLAGWFAKRLIRPTHA
jgi:predicted ATP-grasp superfamily ATP-dependent carboligase